MPTEGPLTDAGLEVWPRGMYDLVTQISREYNHPIIEITESGCGYLDGPDEEENGRIPDGRRIQWYREVLAELARAIADGARVRAFHAWTLLDNFQWAEGYTERYGLIYTDFRNQKRTIKDSRPLVRSSCCLQSAQCVRLVIEERANQPGDIRDLTKRAGV